MDKIIVMPLKRYAFLSKACGKNKSDTAIISPRFAFTLPTALPIAIAALPSPAAMDDVISSGKVVPMLTTVAPMKDKPHEKQEHGKADIARARYCKNFNHCSLRCFS